MSLTEPTIVAQQRSSSLTDLIIPNIDATAKKRITFANFMQLALFDPQYGYYNSGQVNIGEHGDFVTAPTLSPLFSHSLATQVTQIFQHLPNKNMIEFGAGTGDLAVQLLYALDKQDSLPEKYFILEPSPYLRLLQEKKLSEQCPQFIDRITWLTRLPKKALSAVIIANEVIDAMPVHMMHYANKQLQEAYITHDNNTLQWTYAQPSTAKLIDYWQQLSITQDNYITEINLLALAWLASVNDLLQQGAILLIDYGFPRHEYYHPSRNMGTLMCHYQQQAHTDPLLFPGLQDITAHVDFTALAFKARSLGLTVSGFTSQAAFLLNCEILTHLQQAQQQCETQTECARLNQQLQLLTAPHEMGELFKVMALTRDLPISLYGFKQYDQRHRL